MSNGGWQDQWGRVQRRLEGLRQVYTVSAMGSAEALDAVHSFFESVHHLKDWIGNDPGVPLRRSDGDALINGSQVLQIAADVANGSKHLQLTSSRSGDPSTGVGRKDVLVIIGTGASFKFYIASGGSEYDSLKLAEDAVLAWEAFLKQHGLL